MLHRSIESATFCCIRASTPTTARWTILSSTCQHTAANARRVRVAASINAVDLGPQPRRTRWSTVGSMRPLKKEVRYVHQGPPKPSRLPPWSIRPRGHGMCLPVRHAAYAGVRRRFFARGLSTRRPLGRSRDRDDVARRTRCRALCERSARPVRGAAGTQLFHHTGARTCARGSSRRRPTPEGGRRARSAAWAADPG